MFLHNNNELSETEIKKTIQLTITSKRIKYLVINLTKEAKDLYLENCNTLMEETENVTKRWKDIPCSWPEELILLKGPYFPRQSTDSMQSLSKCHFSKN